MLYNEGCRRVFTLNHYFINSHNFFFSVSELLHSQLKFSKHNPCLNVNFIWMHEEEQLQTDWRNMLAWNQKSSSLFLPISCPFI